MKNSIYAITRFFERPRNVIYSLLAIILILAVATVSLYSKVRSLENPNLATASEIKSIVSQISKSFVLPENETPTIATVSDPDKLKGQAFFANAQVGDKVLIYSLARRAILWRPSISKVIEVSNLNTPTP